jgi:hypothetical protein
MDQGNANQGPGGEEGASPQGGAPQGGPPVQGAYSQQISHSPVSARVPERIARGVLTTGVIVLDSPNEFVLDFLQALSRPPQVVARVVLPPQVMFSFVSSLRDNLGKFAERYGAPAPLPKPPQQNRPTIQELYEHFKLPEDLLSGTYANSVLIGHSPSEFLFDFITGFYPTAAVSSRVYLSAQQAPRVLETLSASLVTFQRRFQSQFQIQPPGTQGPQQQPPQAQPPAQPPGPPDPQSPG